MKVPLLLRPVEDGADGHYRVVGEAYIHGLMQGEAVKMEGFKLEKIVLE